MALTLHGTVSDNIVALDRKTATPLIINGDMQIAQRGATVTGVTSSGYASLDRYQMDMASQGTFTISQSTDVPTGQGFLNSMKLDCTTADASLGASDRVAFRQKIEDQNCIAIKKGTANAETLTVAFWVKSNKTGTYVIELYDFANARQVSQSYTIDSANTWEKKVLSYPADTTGTMDNDNTSGIGVQFWITAGTTYTGGTLNTTWNSDTTANRASGLTVNIADSTSNDWYMTGLQLEIGTFDANSIPPFQFEDAGTSLARCQRYFTKTLAALEGSSGGVGSKKVFWFFKQTMRATPTISFVNGAKDGDTFLTADGYGIYRTGDNSPNIGSGTTADAEL